MAEQLYPEPAVGALVFDGKGRILMCKSPKWGNRFIVPGGHVETGETLEQALRREIKEETGLEVSGIKFLVFFECIFSKEFHKRKHLLFFDFVCRAKKPEELRIDNLELTEAIWIEPERALKELDLEHYTRKDIEEFLKGEG